jgi:hypothetical protein
MKTVIALASLTLTASALACSVRSVEAPESSESFQTADSGARQAAADGGVAFTSDGGVAFTSDELLAQAEAETLRGQFGADRIQPALVWQVDNGSPITVTEFDYFTMVGDSFPTGPFTVKGESDANALEVRLKGVPYPIAPRSFTCAEFRGVVKVATESGAFASADPDAGAVHTDCSMTITSVGRETLPPELLVVPPRKMTKGKLEATVQRADTGELHTVRAAFIALEID